MVEPGTELPIVVDIDGVIVRSRWLDEALVEIAREQPLRLFSVFRHRRSGAAIAKAFIAESVSLDVDMWPVNAEFLAYLAEQSERGRRIVLATSTPERVTSAFARKYPFLGEIVRLRDGADALETARALTDAFPRGFVYAGTASTDAPVWQAAARRIAVNVPDRQRDRIGDSGIDQAFDIPRPDVSGWRSALRLHQWSKNLLVFVPLVLGGRGDEIEVWLHALIGALAISLVASAMYLINDLLDLPSDRRHWSKKARAIASGEVSIRRAVALAIVLVVLGAGLAATQGAGPLAVVIIYMLLTFLYSAYWKGVPILDVFVLAGLFTLRLWLGIVLTDVRLSPWLLVFSMFLFLSLSLAKRHTELLRLQARGLAAAPGRAYRVDDAPLTLALGVASSMAGVLIMILYLIEDAFPRQQYAEPQFLWAVPPILFLFVGRLWLLCQRGELSDDPVDFAMKDRVSLLLGGVMAVIAVLALVGTGLW